MKRSDTGLLFKPSFLDSMHDYLELTSSSPLSIKRDSKISDIALEEKYWLFFSIVNQSSNAVVITDHNKLIIYVNEKFERVSGYTFSEVLGKNPKILSANKTPIETYRGMNCTLYKKQKWKGEFINIHRDGYEYVEEAVISPIMNDAGDIVFFLGEKTDITLQKKAEKTVQELTCFDSLTGIYNRAYFVEEVGRIINSSTVEENHFAILFVDLNRFKKLNDIYGHLSGDKALKIIAKRLENIISPDDFIARVGGDEFVVVHKNASDESTSRLAAKIVDGFLEPVMIDGQDNYLGASVGSAIWPKDGLTLTQILSRADLAMYNAKIYSRNYSPYTTEIGFKYTREFELSRKLRLAIQDNQLFLVYQPKIDLKTGKIDGVEALLRWEDDELGMISPAEFIPIAEKYKMMTSIGNWVILEVCRQLNRWKAENNSFSGRVAINLSVLQIEYLDFYEQILSILSGENISPNEIELEVTESLLISDPDNIMILFSKLKSVGFSISIDDFGTGYSSLSYLNKLRVNNLKIDRSFIEKITIDNHEQAIVKSIIELGHNLGLSVVAEGVETREQLNYLLSLGCDVAQGYLFYRPLPAGELFPFADMSVNHL